MDVLPREYRHRIIDALRAEVDQSARSYSQARQRYWKIWAEVSNGFSPSDRQAMAEAESAQVAAMVAYADVLRRFNQFLLAGTIPDDLKEPPATEC